MRRLLSICAASIIVLGIAAGAGEASAQFDGNGGMYFGSLNYRPPVRVRERYDAGPRKERAAQRQATRSVRRPATATAAASSRTLEPAVAAWQKRPEDKRIEAMATDAAVVSPAVATVREQPTVTVAAKAHNAAESRRKTSTVAENGNDPVQLIVSIPDQRVAVYRGLTQIASSRVSTGRPGHATPSGVFSIIGKAPIHYSNLYGSAPMPWMQRITWSGVALHAGNVSRPYASHGCIRLPYGFAQTLYKRTKMGAHVVVAAGMSSPVPISSSVLPQPSATTTASATESRGTETSALAIGNAVAATASDADVDGIPNFIPPVEEAANRLDEARQAREEVEAALPGLETTVAAARDVAARQKSAVELAQKTVVERQMALARTDTDIARIQRQLDAEKKNLVKLQRAASWSEATIEKRRNDPRFEGSWMTEALARLEQRRALVAEAEASKLLVQNECDAAVAGRRTDAESLKQARAKAAAEVQNAAEANAQARVASDALESGKRAVTGAEAAIRKASDDLRASQRREKMPLRVVITPLNNQERIKVAQRLLAELGYEGVEPVGYLGKLTSAAISTIEVEMGIPATGRVSEAVISELYRRVGREQTTNAHMYVRQGFLDLFDLPVIIKDPEKPLGTHVFTALYFEDGATDVEWTALAVKERGSVTSVARTGGKRNGKKVAAASALTSARDVLDRISIPDNARRQLSGMLTPGSSIVITDNGISHETGRGTDFVILTK